MLPQTHSDDSVDFWLRILLAVQIHELTLPADVRVNPSTESNLAPSDDDTWQSQIAEFFWCAIHTSLIQFVPATSLVVIHEIVLHSHFSYLPDRGTVPLTLSIMPHPGRERKSWESTAYNGLPTTHSSSLDGSQTSTLLDRLDPLLHLLWSLHHIDMNTENSCPSMPFLLSG